MKKIQRSFVTEYKSGRRKIDPQSNSIWGNIDLKSVARDVQEEATSRLPVGGQAGTIASEVPRDVKQGQQLLTPSIQLLETATAPKESMMADGNEIRPNNDGPGSVVAATDTPRKTRETRTKKAAPEIASVEVAVRQIVDNRSRQASGPKLKSKEVVNGSNGVPVKHTTQVQTSAPLAAIDELADLLQLEQENQRLRRLLAQKLSAENADLRRRLNLA